MIISTSTGDPHANLATLVEPSRARAAALGELKPPAIGPIESVFTDEARSIVAQWKRDEGSTIAWDGIGEADPNLAVQ